MAKYALETNQTRLTDFVVTSNRFREGLSEEDLAAVVEEFEKRPSGKGETRWDGLSDGLFGWKG